MSVENALELFPPADLQNLLYACALLALAVVLLVLEIFIVSFGLLLVAAVACAGGAIYLAFAASSVAGWFFVLLVPLLGFFLVRWGIRRIRHSRIVPQSEISSEAGYHHVADRIGVEPGSTGTLITRARPSGRARFDGGECDVQVRGGSLERGDQVVVQQIEGPIVFVVPKVQRGDAGEAAGAAAPAGGRNREKPV